MQELRRGTFGRIVAELGLSLLGTILVTVLVIAVGVWLLNRP
jgi:hypothetical protein